MAAAPTFMVHRKQGVVLVSLLKFSDGTRLEYGCRVFTLSEARDLAHAILQAIDPVTD